MNPKPPRLIQGNEACVEGAISAGMRFYAGYPITPSSEIAELCASKLPKLGGTFTQMEDELASIAAIIGASLAGVKAMTATSGPGFSLMQENIGYAAITEIPVLIVNVQRLGPSTGIATAPAQGDFMQARWGTHGDHPVIVLAPASVKEMYELTIRAFNLSERYRVPTILLADEVIGHLRESVLIDPDLLPFPVIDRRKPVESPEFYLPYLPGEDGVPPMADFGDGYRYHVTGLIHDPAGFPTSKPEEVESFIRRLNGKIDLNRGDIEDSEGYFLEDAEIAIVAFGSTARSALRAVKIGREQGLRLGLFRPKTLHPFPEKALSEISKQVTTILVPEMNLGQMVLEVERLAGKYCEVVRQSFVSGELPRPEDILEKVRTLSRAVL